MQVKTEAPPLRADEYGVIRVSDTRVTLDSIIGAYKQGHAPEYIAEGFPTVPLADIHAAIAYYLRHKDEIDAYLEEQKKEGERIRAEHEARFGPGPTRAELMARLQRRSQR